MKVIKVENQVQGGKVAFEILKEKLANGAQTLGLATGSSPLEFYKEIVESDLDFSNLTSVNLDEYVGLDGDNPQSYRYFMQENLFNQKPFKESFLPRGVKDNAEAEAEVERYNQILADHPVDLQILGIGRNGHIGFNEPGTPFDSQTHLVELDQSTIEANARFFAKIEDVPTQAISMGIKNILDAKSIILFAYGESKAEAIAGTVSGPVTENLPASSLQNHPDVTIIADAEALSLLEK
ncbi:TPA: glucosamine-6-phosphate deaminase [Streptococcus pneumoniae]|nr:glucosamine-6-phosphate deaminase [Streptococcus pneumoniae]